MVWCIWVHLCTVSVRSDLFFYLKLEVSDVPVALRSMNTEASREQQRSSSRSHPMKSSIQDSSSVLTWMSLITKIFYKQILYHYSWFKLKTVSVRELQSLHSNNSARVGGAEQLVGGAWSLNLLNYWHRLVTSNCSDCYQRN